MPDANRPLRMTVVLVAYNMAREIPRTVKSLSATMQRGLGHADYEILLVDNGSTQAFDEALCKSLAPNLRVLRVPDAGPSPVHAINMGLAAAQGELVGVMIDGARMASPGLLATALAASRVHRRAVVGTLAFHLGPDVQPRSVANGYDQQAEDRLLASSGWDSDGYRLFDISVFAGSSQDGWFVVPAETNALFLRAELWSELGGFDEGFVGPGGGLANLDTWSRACALADTQVVMLLGEGTFHQVHGGIATNSPISKWPTFHEEYVRLRGRAYERPRPTPTFYGSLAAIPRATLEHSLHRHYDLSTPHASRP
ncbi:glycosyltransferase [Ramlibacter sp. PS3R-8]|uniref:glycosyltransferase family 2 protein n=1 Tax=Ramlibacter sp. PS3R-8 TaxID=3133437 RepID=UPI003099F009